MGIIKTKEVLVDVARKLFAVKGFENTTMNDIALASQKGRRTLYTYFKSKEEIYFAVVESELSQLADKLKLVAKKNTSPEERLVEYIYIRMDAIKEVVNRNGNLKADFFRDIRQLERVRRELNVRERKILKEILLEGMEQKVFNIQDPDFTALMVHYALRGFEVLYIRGELENLMKEKKDSIIDFLFYGIKKNCK
jgi:AcrR family transcriptional regulator